MKILPMVAELFHTDRRTDITKLTVANGPTILFKQLNPFLQLTGSPINETPPLAVIFSNLNIFQYYYSLFFILFIFSYLRMSYTLLVYMRLQCENTICITYIHV